MTNLEKAELAKCRVCAGPYDSEDRLSIKSFHVCSSKCDRIGLPIPIEDLGMGGVLNRLYYNYNPTCYILAYNLKYK